MKRQFLALLLAMLASTAFALPTVDDVRAEIGKGDYARAEQMMKEVIVARPDSARGHYVYAEILAHNKRFEQALGEANRAKELDPALKFTSADKFNAFTQLIEREQAAARKPGALTSPSSATPPAVREAVREAARAPAGNASDNGIPAWGWGLGVGALALIAMAAFRSRRQSAATASAGPAGMSGAAMRPGSAAPGYGPAAPGYGNAGYGQQAAPMQGGFGGRGGGMLGTGMAIAGGAAAGMLAERMLHGDHGANPAAGNPALDGLTPGAFDNASPDSSARELAQRDVDLGNGADWGNDDAPGPFADNDSGGGDDSSW